MATTPRLAPGTIFARDYHVVDLLAEGGMGAVYRAEQLSTRKLRALKLVSTRLASDPKGRQRFVREATIGASIDSEHVVEVIGAGIDDETDRPWLAMELLDGADLGAVVLHQGPLSPGQLREVAGQLCHGLSAAHRAGVVHRDLKPANVFIARSRRAGVPFTLKILDFGIAKVVQESGTTASETDTVGSPLWMAPEQLNAQRPTPATDVWALGLLAFWALTGKHYWIAAHAESSTVQALFVEQLFKPIEAPSRRAAELGARAPIPAGFDEWFLVCTQREPGRRFADAAAAGEALAALLPADPAGAASLLPATTLPPSVSTTERQRIGAESTMTAGAQWDASAVVPGAAVAAARTGLEHEPTRTEPSGLGADLSRAPLPGASPSPARARGPSAIGVMLAVAAVVGVLAGGGFLAWQQWSDRSPQPPVAAEVEVVDGPPVAPTPLAITPDEGEGDDGTLAPPSPDDPLLAPVVPRRTQLDDQEMHDVRFLGWSDAGHRFALEVRYPSGKDGTSSLELVQVHDALTGLMVESFGEAPAGASLSRTLERAAAEAEPRARWPARRDALRLHKGSPHRSGPAARGGATLHVASADAPPGTQIALPPSELGAAFRWSIDPVAAPQGPSRHAPDVTLSIERDGASHVVLRIDPHLTTQQVLARWVPGAAESPAAVGRVLAYWSPHDERVVLLVEIDGRPAGEPPLVRRRWAVRAAGPQIRLVEAGAGERRVREVAQRLAAAGMPVARAELRAAPVAESRLLHAERKGTDALAERVRAALPVPLTPTPTRIKRDGGEVVVILGHDAQ